MNMTDKEIFERIPAPLLLWYRQNKRDLPWRKKPTPYQVWVSEIMLQQTRVEAVKEYFVRFMQALPTVEDLARCEEEKLLKLWEGLGYYSRARNLQKAAKQIVFDYGEFPSETEDLKRLAGVGSYTAGAIASIAFGKREAAVDGNVFRVASRLTENPTVISSAEYRRYLEREISAIYPPQGNACAEFTQSLFELGALICKPQNPDCGSCPLSKICKANKHGTQREFPVLPIKKPKREEDVYVFLIETAQGFCVRRRDSGVLKGMNEFPSVVSNGESVESALHGLGIDEYETVAIKKYAHIFTHIRWNITCVWIKTESAEFDAYTIDEIKESISLPTAFKQCMEMLKEKEI